MRKIASLAGIFLIFSLTLFATTATPSSGKNQEDKEKDPYIELSTSLSSIANTISSQGQKDPKVSSEEKPAPEGKGSENDNNTDFIFKVYQVWQWLIDTQIIEGDMKTWYNLLNRTGGQRLGIFTKELFGALVVIEFVILFLSGELDLGSFLKTIFYATAIYFFTVAPHDYYYQVFFALHDGFEKIVTAGVTALEWDQAVHYLTNFLFVDVLSSPIAPLQPFLLLVAVFLYIFLYFVYLPAITLPFLLTNLLILGLFVLGKFALLFSILSPFRKFAVSFVSSFVAIELYRAVLFHLIFALGDSLRVAENTIFGGPINWETASGVESIKLLLFVGPLAALFLALDVVALNIIRSIFTVIFFPARASGTTAGVTAAGGAAATTVKAAETGARIAE